MHNYQSERAMNPSVRFLKKMLVKTDLRKEGGMKNKKNRMLEHMCSCISPGHA